MTTFQPAINTSESSPTQRASVARPSKSAVGEKVLRIFKVFLGVLTTYHLLDAGLARFFALETLTHGTNPMAFLGINRKGALPVLGGNLQGSSAALGHDVIYVEASKGFFHMFRDSELRQGYPRNFIEPSIRSLCGAVACELAIALEITATKFSRLKLHTILSIIAAFIGPAPFQSPSIRNILKFILVAMVGLLTPVLKFRFKPDEIETSSWYNTTHTEGPPTRIGNDPYYNDGWAYRTQHKISPHRLGITGALTQGIRSGTGAHMKANIKKVISGIILLLGAFYTARATYKHLKRSDEASSSQEAETSKPRPSFLRSTKTVAACLLVTILNSFLNTL